MAVHPEGGVPSHEGPLWYSIASADDGATPPVLTLAIGPGTGAEILAAAVPGTLLSLPGPFGSFTLPAAPGVLLVGVGTGVAPLRALVQEALASDEEVSLLLLVGARTEQDLLWHDELSESGARRGRLRYEPVLSQAGAAWLGRRGYVQDHLKSLVPSLPPGFAARVCGSKSMVESVLADLRGLGVPEADLAGEGY